jgi:hypothetical protein
VGLAQLTLAGRNRSQTTWLKFGRLIQELDDRALDKRGFTVLSWDKKITRDRIAGKVVEIQMCIS